MGKIYQKIAQKNRDRLKESLLTGPSLIFAQNPVYGKSTITLLLVPLLQEILLSWHGYDELSS